MVSSGGFKVKDNANDSINKYKARLVAKGFHQQHGFDFHETLSLIVKQTTIQIILTIAITCKCEIQKIGINNVFLNGDLQEEVYMQQPRGFLDIDSTLVCKLDKCIYGLKQASCTWYENIHQYLLHFSFISSQYDQSLLIYQHLNVIMYALLYVDDILFTGLSPSLLHKLINKLAYDIFS